MMMYEKLVRMLRNCGTQIESCNTCDLVKDAFCSDTLMKQAADAIEEMSRRIDQAVDMYNRDIEKAAMYEVLIGSSPEPPKEAE